MRCFAYPPTCIRQMALTSQIEAGNRLPFPVPGVGQSHRKRNRLVLIINRHKTLPLRTAIINRSRNTPGVNFPPTTNWLTRLTFAFCIRYRTLETKSKLVRSTLVRKQVKLAVNERPLILIFARRTSRISLLMVLTLDLTLSELALLASLALLWRREKWLTNRRPGTINSSTLEKDPGPLALTRGFKLTPAGPHQLDTPYRPLHTSTRPLTHFKRPGMSESYTQPLPDIYTKHLPPTP